MSPSHTQPDELPPPGRFDAEFAGGAIVRAQGGLLDPAVTRLVESASGPDPRHARRFLEYTAQHQINLDGLWALVDKRGDVRASVLGVPGAGRTAMFFASHPRNAGEVAAVGRLIDHACRHADSSAIHLAQTLLDVADHLEHQSFIAGGFHELASLSYLERAVPRGRSARLTEPTWPGDAEIRPYDDSLAGVMVDILDASYEDTLDCPGLRGCRRTQDILEGHRASGRFDPRLWTLLRVDGRWAGALLLNPAHGHQTIELVYLGLSKWARGRGLGRSLVQHGLMLVRDRPERVINLAVDDANAPALSLYQREGFRPVLRRRAMIRSLVPAHGA
jgi:ribosomal protein S18 acetylase RimI-like enzyme